MPNLNLRDTKIMVCTKCYKYNYRNKWKKFKSVELIIEEIFEKRLSGKIDQFSVKPHIPKFKFNPGVNAKIEVEIIRGNNSYLVPADICLTICDKCSKQQGDYFEGILQIKNINDLIRSFAENYFKKKEVYCCEKKEKKDIYQIKVNNKKELQNLGKKLVERFGGKLKISPHLHSYDSQKSKKIYRVNVFYEAFPFDVGEVIETDSKVIKITKLGRLVHGKNLKNDKSTSIDLKNKDYRKLQKYQTTVSKTYPNIEVLHPETYQSVKPQNKTKVKSGEKVKVVINEERIYLV